MDCMKSFNISIIGNKNYTTSNSLLNYWISSGTGDIYWSLRSTELSRYTIEGFRNINLYRIEVVGQIIGESVFGGTGGAIVNDWGFQIYCEATTSLTSGIIQTSPNYWNIDASGTNSRKFTFTKTLNSINFPSPLQSLKYIEFQQLNADGIGAQGPNLISLDFNLNFVFYYKYEDE